MPEVAWPEPQHLQALPGQVLWLVANATRANTVRAKLGPTTARVTTIAEFVSATTSSTRKLTPTFARLIMDAVIPSFTGKDKLNHFHAIADTAGFTRMALATVTHTRTAGIVLNEPENERTKDIARILARFEGVQKKLSRFDVVGQMQLVAENTKPFTTFIVDEGVARNQAEASLVEALSAKANTTVTVTPKVNPHSPPALAHAATQWRNPTITPETKGLSFIDAAGPVNETQLVARRIAELLHAGTNPHAIVLALREVPPYGGLWGETFAEYRIPVSVSNPGTLQQVPPLAQLVRAWQVPVEEFKFADVAAVLRSSFFQPPWLKDATHPTKAEALFRELKEPRGRDSYRNALNKWADEAIVPLADEEMEISKKEKTKQLAKQLQPFIHSFLELWDEVDTPRVAKEWVKRLQDFANAFGFEKTLRETERPGWSLFWTVLNEWADDATLLNGVKPILASRFQTVLKAILEVEPAPALQPTVAGVRILPIENAVDAHCDYLFLPECGEGSWPGSHGTDSLFFSGGGENVEAILFTKVLRTPSKELIISRPAYDAKGYELLKPRYLVQLERCFAGKAIPRHAQKMAIENYAQGQAFSPAELRVQTARYWKATGQPAPLPAATENNLRAARVQNQQRFERKDFTPYDGALSKDKAFADVQKAFGPESIISPTALEAFSACPFRFWLQNVLRLKPLEDPPEQLEATLRGKAIHRALAALHAELPELEPEQTERPLNERFHKAVEEYRRDLQDGITKELWALEQERLKRTAILYQKHWAKQKEPLAKKQIVPKPRQFEVAFGKKDDDKQDLETHEKTRDKEKKLYEPLVLEHNGITVKVGGTIDRVDLVQFEHELGYWIIDYKTGSGQKYTGPAVERYEVIQLPLYALAYEHVIGKDNNPKLMGLVYWFIDGDGAKQLKGYKPTAKNTFEADMKKSEEDWFTLSQNIVTQVTAWVGQIREARFPLNPRSETCQDTCPYGSVCRISQSRETVKRKAEQIENKGITF